MANSWTRGAAHRHTTAPISALGLHPVARELLYLYTYTYTYLFSTVFEATAHL